MKILITGSAGLLGQKLLARMATMSDIALTATVKPLQNPTKHTPPVRELDITNPIAVTRVITETKPDIIIHAAALTQVDLCEQERERCRQTNTVAVEHLTAVCREIDAHFILISTDFVFDGCQSPLDENAPPNPINHYGKSKLEAEHIVQNSGIQWSIIRTALVYGVTLVPVRPNIVLWIKKALEQKKHIHMVDDQWRTPTLVEDLAMGCQQIACRRMQGLYHVAGKEVLTPYAIAIRTARSFNLDTTLIHSVDSTTFRQPAKRPLKTALTITKAQTILDYQPHTFDQGLQVIATQLKDQ